MLMTAKPTGADICIRLKQELQRFIIRLFWPKFLSVHILPHGTMISATEQASNGLQAMPVPEIGSGTSIKSFADRPALFRPSALFRHTRKPVTALNGEWRIPIS